MYRNPKYVYMFLMVVSLVNYYKDNLVFPPYFVIFMIPEVLGVIFLSQLVKFSM